MKKFVLVLSLPLLFGFVLFSYECDLKGHLRIHRNSTYSNLHDIEIFVKGNEKFLGKTKTDKKGNFNLFFLVNQEKAFLFYAVPVKGDTILLKTVTRFKSQTPAFTFYLPGKK
ncbi:MAG: hypothetical protein ACTHMD_17585 [Flavisolibacter sp.]